MELAQAFIENRKEKDIHLGAIKKRFSKTVGHEYTSFGCYKCDSIFGDWFVFEAKIDLMYDQHELTYQGEIELSESFILQVAHWCFPENNRFCN